MRNFIFHKNSQVSKVSYFVIVKIWNLFKSVFVKAFFRLEHCLRNGPNTIVVSSIMSGLFTSKKNLTLAQYLQQLLWSGWISYRTTNPEILSASAFDTTGKLTVRQNGSFLFQLVILGSRDVNLFILCNWETWWRQKLVKATNTFSIFSYIKI